MLRNFYSHISARCDNQLIEEMAELTHFYSHISARCDRQFCLCLQNQKYFYSHISARCDSLIRSERVCSEISTLTSLRDVTDRLYDAYLAAKISTLTSLRDVTGFALHQSR